MEISPCESGYRQSDLRKLSTLEESLAWLCKYPYAPEPRRENALSELSSLTAALSSARANSDCPPTSCFDDDWTTGQRLPQAEPLSSRMSEGHGKLQRASGLRSRLQAQSKCVGKTCAHSTCCHIWDLIQRTVQPSFARAGSVQRRSPSLSRYLLPCLRYATETVWQ